VNAPRYGTTHSKAFFWFAQVLWLKTAINLIHSFGRSHFHWHVWMNLVLVMSVSVMLHVEPYISPIDQQVRVGSKVCVCEIVG
jgi:hypothetical protein